MLNSDHAMPEPQSSIETTLHVARSLVYNANPDNGGMQHLHQVRF